jgi:Holliday junction DNA helicase RuvA
LPPRSPATVHDEHGGPDVHDAPDERGAPDVHDTEGGVIGSVRGTVLERTTAGEVLVEVGGVGYRVLVPLGALTMFEPGGAAFLFTHLHVREDALVLYGFPTREERDTFEVLIGATGVGPKLALAILSVHSPFALRRALLDDDVDALTLVPGVGKRTAQRMLVDLKARLDLPDVDLTEPEPGRSAAPRVEVREALASLGYAPEEVRAVVTQLPDDGSVEDLLRDALKLLAVSRA